MKAPVLCQSWFLENTPDNSLSAIDFLKVCDTPDYNEWDYRKAVIETYKHDNGHYTITVNHKDSAKDYVIDFTEKERLELAKLLLSTVTV